MSIAGELPECRVLRGSGMRAQRVARRKCSRVARVEEKRQPVQRAGMDSAAPQAARQCPEEQRPIRRWCGLWKAVAAVWGVEATSVCPTGLQDAALFRSARAPRTLM